MDGQGGGPLASGRARPARACSKGPWRNRRRARLVPGSPPSWGLAPQRRGIQAVECGPEPDALCVTGHGHTRGSIDACKYSYYHKRHRLLHLCTLNCILHSPAGPGLLTMRWVHETGHRSSMEAGHNDKEGGEGDDGEDGGLREPPGPLFTALPYRPKKDTLKDEVEFRDPLPPRVLIKPLLPNWEHWYR